MDDRHRLRRIAPVLSLIVVSAALFMWQLDRSGYANSYYSAAGQAGAQSWKAMFFGSLDAGNGITVDKPPFGLWPMGLSVRVFGLSSWSILLPQAVEGVGSVVLLYACVRRVTGQTWPGVIAGAVFALTPVTVLVFRYNNPDAMLTLLLLGCAYATLRALDSDRSAHWLVLVGALAGFGFLTKMLEAFLVLPALAVTYAVFGPRRLVARLRHLALGGLAIVVAAGWWITIVELWPARDRPFIGGSPTNSVLQLALGYNGLGRLTGSTGTTATDGGFGATNIARIGRTDLGGEITWLLPAALVLAALAWHLSRDHPARKRIRASLLLWTTWLLVASTTFLVMAGIFHSYYTVVLAPAIASLVAIGLWLAWDRRDEPAVRRLLAIAVAATAALAVGTVAAVGHELRWWAAPILLLGVGATLVLSGWSGPKRLSPLAAIAALSVSLIGPALFSWATIQAPHVGSAPMAGPGHAASSTALVVSDPSIFGIHFLDGSCPVTRSVVSTLQGGGAQYRWSAVTLGARSAAAYQLALGEPVLAVGGYKGTDPTPTLPAFIELVRSRQLHWFVPGGTSGAAGDAIKLWVVTHGQPVRIAGCTIYDLSNVVASQDATAPARQAVGSSTP
jgi:4-amino-4-deoxy-L-arabinose transferase-like glycosyltransferase